jgi:hypothetical protein
VILAGEERSNAMPQRWLTMSVHLVNGIIDLALTSTSGDPQTTVYLSNADVLLGKMPSLVCHRKGQLSDVRLNDMDSLWCSLPLLRTDTLSAWRIELTCWKPF